MTEEITSVERERGGEEEGAAGGVGRRVNREG